MALSPTLTTLRAAIKLLIQTGMDSGSPATVLTVHDKLRFWRDPDKFFSLFKRLDAGAGSLLGKINGWMFTRTSTRVLESEERWRFYSLHTFTLYGYMGVEDGAFVSETAMQDQIEAIRDRFRLATTVFGNMEKTVADVEVVDFGKYELADVNCWQGILRFSCEAIEIKSL